MKQFNKLVRDKIPDIIASNNEKAVTRVLGENEYIKELNIKLQEEVNEYFVDENVEELADIVEVIYGILDSKNIKLEDFEKIRNSKIEKRGAFKKRIFLEYTLNNEKE